MAYNDNFKVVAIPFDIKLGDKEANISKLREMMQGMPADADVVVLPELWSTGYNPSKEVALSLAEENNGNTINELKTVAKKYNLAISGSFLAKEGEKIYNRAFFIEPSGECTFYDKRHLFILSEESKIAERGMKLSPIVRFRGWNIAMAVCYDIRFPQWNRNTKMKYDLLIVPANWPVRREFAWTHILQARAIENQAYVVGANRSGTDDYGNYDNLTFIYDYLGKQVSTASDSYVEAVLSKSKLERFRETFPIWKDADDAMIIF